MKKSKKELKEQDPQDILVEEKDEKIENLDIDPAKIVEEDVDESFDPYLDEEDSDFVDTEDVLVAEDDYGTDDSELYAPGEDGFDDFAADDEDF